MANIQPNKRGKILQAKKRIKKRLTQLANADQLTAGQRDQLFAQNLTELNRIVLQLIGKEEDID